jgi:carotenoid cleavage dioxygenase-like enzyme
MYKFLNSPSWPPTPLLLIKMGESSEFKIPPWYSFHLVNAIKLYTTPISSNICVVFVCLKVSSLFFVLVKVLGKL